MSWSYDPTDLDNNTSTGRINSVRFLVGDTDISDQQVSNEEITFSLDIAGDNIYGAASIVANALASKYSRLVDVELDGALKESLSQLSKNYFNLSIKLKDEGKKSGSSFGVVAGGILITKMNINNLKTNRVKPAFYKDQFKNPRSVTVDEDYDDWY